jgi:hypothetical protein
MNQNAADSGSPRDSVCSEPALDGRINHKGLRTGPSRYPRERILIGDILTPDRPADRDRRRSFDRRDQRGLCDVQRGGFDSQTICCGELE